MVATSWPAIIAVAGCVLLFGFSKTAMPVAGVLASPILALTLSPARAAGFVLPLLLVGDLIALGYFRQHADWRLIWRLVPGVLAGFALTAVCFVLLSPTGLGRVVGALILTSVVLEAWRFRSRGVGSGEIRGNRLAVAFYGTLAGMTSMAANAGGTAMSLYLLRMRVPMLAFMGTSAWFFFCLNLIKLGFMIPLELITPSTLLVDLAYAPVLALGALIGIRVFRRMNMERFAATALILSAVAAVWLLVHG
jgi:uncharacterized membrane protein YfcA